MKLSQLTIWIVTGLSYEAWSTAFDNLKAVREEPNDGSSDWGLFHEERLRNAVAAEKKYKVVLEELATLQAVSP